MSKESRESKETQKRVIALYGMLVDKWMSVGQITQALNDAGHKISKRSMERDLADLEHVGGLYSKRDPTHSRRILWKVDTIDFSGPGSINVDSALAIAVAQKQLALTVPKEITTSLKDAFERANRILERQTNTDASRCYRRVRVVSPSHVLKAPQLDDDVITCIRTAALNNEVVKFKYKEHSYDVLKDMIATGLALVYRGSVAYFVAYDHDSGRERNFPISRIEDAELMPVTSSPQGVDKFDIDKESLLNIKYDESFDLKAIIFDSVLREIDEAHLGDNQKITAIAGHTKFRLLEVTVPCNLDLIHWLLARAPYLKVIGPSGFIAKFDKEVKQAFNNMDKEFPYIPSTKNFGGKGSNAE
jgi:predicted DNA-binding transcriptional regulator YafY